jgi:hypothetical protein
MARPASWLAKGGALAACLAMSGCATPVPTARSGADYDRKAAHTAEEVRSAVQTTIVALRSAADGRLLDRTLDVLVTEAEDDAGGAAETFLAEQPPDGGHTDATRAALSQLLDDATAHLAAARIAVRRGDDEARHDELVELRHVADDLEAFTEDVEP